MAWKLKVTEVDGIELRMEGDPPVQVEFDLTSTGRWRAHVIYYDSAAPAEILYEQDFVFYANEVGAAQALAEAQIVGATVRNARAQIAALQLNVGVEYSVP